MAETTTTTTAQTLNPFIQDILARNYGFASEIAAQPYQPYQGPRIAEFRPTERAAFDVATRAATNRVGSEQLGAATDVARNVAGYSPEQFQRDVSGFMSPFQTSVIDATMARLAQNRAERDAATKAQMAASRAFGNERRGVYEAQLAGEQDLNTAQTLANLYSQGYGAASELASALPGKQLSGAEALARYGAQGLTNEATYAAMLQGVGMTERDMAQRNLDLAREDALRQQNYDRERLNLLLAATPSASPVTATVTQPGQSTLSQIGSAASTVGGILDLFKKG